MKRPLLKRSWGRGWSGDLDEIHRLIGIASGDLCDAERPPLDTGQEPI